MADTDFTETKRSQRFFNDPVNSPYILPADAEEGERLNLQYEVIKCSTGGKRIIAPVQLVPGDRVLDSATGTGVWLLDVASVSPATVSFHGIDISPHLFPLAAYTPSNVSFSQRSILGPPPRSFSSSIALINQRLLTVALPAADWPSVLRAHFEMLRPGGCIQLCEINFARFSWPDGACTARVHAMLRALFSACGLDWECALHLEGWARDAGFVNVGTLSTCGPVGARAGGGPQNFSKSLLDAFMAMNESMQESGIISNEQEYEKSIHEMEAEWNNMDDAYYPFQWLWAQKPRVIV